MGIIGSALLVAHRHIEQLLACFLQTWRGGVILDAVILQIVKPFLYRGGGHAVELVHTDDVILREYVMRHAHTELLCLLDVHLKQVIGMDTSEDGLAMIEIVAALAEVEVEYVYRINLLHFVIFLPNIYMLCDGFRYTVEHTLEEMQLAGELHLYNDDFPFDILCLDIDAVELVVSAFLVAFAFK